MPAVLSLGPGLSAWRSITTTSRPCLRAAWRAISTAATQSTAQSHGTDVPAAVQASSQPLNRRDLLKDARPFSDFLTDTYQRQHDYLRISLTERCNLRCVYCMPEEGVPLSPQRELLTTPEIVMLSSVFVSQGVKKIRLTGGEPTVRRDILPLMQQIGALRNRGLQELCLTTNGLALHRKLEGMVEAGLTGVNLSLDTLDPWQFQIMTRRKGFDAVMKSIDKVLELNRHGAGIKLKINCVVMRGVNDREILPFVEMTREQDIEIRFIEYMPFDGNQWNKSKMYSYQEMVNLIQQTYPGLEKVRDHKNDTSKTWKIPGFVGRIGFITSMTHNFCGTCNRLRITSDGNLKVCLFGNAEVSLRDILRKSNNNEPIEAEHVAAIQKSLIDQSQDLMGTSEPLRMAPNEQQLLEVIGMAVKRKKEKHAGIGELEHMKNRPMILIDRRSSIPSALAQNKFQWTNHPFVVPFSLLDNRLPHAHQIRLFSASHHHRFDKSKGEPPDPPKLTHLSSTGSAHMVSIASKQSTPRTAKAVCSVHFTSSIPTTLIRDNALKKGDVLGVARVAGIMAAKRTPDLIPLCHPIMISKVAVELTVVNPKDGTHEGGKVDIEATVSCEGKTGVEMEALTAASTAALTVYDMCKAVDKGMVIEGLRVVLKEGGKSGRWVEGTQEETEVPADKQCEPDKAL